MKLLALDTSSVACTVGLSHGEQFVLRHEEQERAHTRLLVPMVRAVLNEANLELAELDALVLGNGPGSFIGLRIAASLVQGLAFAAGLRVVPVSSMAALAADVGKPGDRIVVAQDAHMSQVYLGFYQRLEGGLVTGLGAERLQSQQAIEELPALPGVIAAGYGWQRYPELLGANRDQLGSVAEQYYPSATALLRMGQAALERGEAISPAEVEPAYLRQTVAQPPHAGVG